MCFWSTFWQNWFGICQYSLHKPCADGTIKHMSNSKTSSLLVVVKFLPYFHIILHHFQFSGNSLAILNETLEMMNMYIMKFWPIEMSCLLSATTQSVKILAALCEVSAIVNVKFEERSYFVLPKSLVVLHILADLQSFSSKLLQKSW